MSLNLTHKEVTAGIGDIIRVSQKVRDAGKERTQVFEGMLIAIKNRGGNKSFTVRKIGEQRIGIERIFPLASPFLEKIEVVKSGAGGTKRAKLYYIRTKSPKEIDKIFSRSSQKSK